MGYYDSLWQNSQVNTQRCMYGWFKPAYLKKCLSAWVSTKDALNLDWAILHLLPLWALIARHLQRKELQIYHLDEFPWVVDNTTIHPTLSSTPSYGHCSLCYPIAQATATKKLMLAVHHYLLNKCEYLIASQRLNNTTYRCNNDAVHKSHWFHSLWDHHPKTLHHIYRWYWNRYGGWWQRVRGRDMPSR